METFQRLFRPAQLADVALDFGDFNARFQIGDGLVVDLVKRSSEVLTMITNEGSDEGSKKIDLDRKSVV